MRSLLTRNTVDSNTFYSIETFILYLAVKWLHITSEMIWYQVIDISLYFHCSVFWITSDFSIHLMQLTSKVQTPITFLFVNKTLSVGSFFLVKTWGTYWYQNNSDLLKFFDFKFSTPPASVSEAMHVTYATQRHQQIMTSLMTSLVTHHLTLNKFHFICKSWWL